MGLKSKLRTLLWFAVRPTYWSHAVALGARKLKADKDTPDLRSGAGKWAAENAVDVDSAYAAIGLPSPTESSKAGLAKIVTEGEVLASSALVSMGGPGAVEFLFGCALMMNAKNIVETGVAYGWSSLAFLSALDEIRSGRLASVDMPYPKAGNEPWVGVCVPERLRSRWTLIREPDRNGVLKAIATCGSGEIDIAHYDSDKSYWGRRWAYPIIWKALRAGGLFISDDIQDNWYFREFAEEVGLEPVVIEYLDKYVGCLRKPVDPLHRTTG